MKYVLLTLAFSALLGLYGPDEASAQSCYKTTITKPSPFLGNHDDVFQISEGDYWKVQFEYEYLYEYYPSVLICPSRGKLIVSNKSLSIALVSRRSSQGRQEKSNCYETILKSNSNSGEILITIEGHVYEVLPGDNIDSMLWLPSSDLLICGPNPFSHKGKTFQFWDVVNTDDGEKVTAQRIK